MNLSNSTELPSSQPSKLSKRIYDMGFDERGYMKPAGGRSTTPYIEFETSRAHWRMLFREPEHKDIPPGMGGKMLKQKKKRRWQKFADKVKALGYELHFADSLVSRVVYLKILYQGKSRIVCFAANKAPAQDVIQANYYIGTSSEACKATLPGYVYQGLANYFADQRLANIKL